MAHTFGDNEKEVKEYSERLPFGINVVQIVGAQGGNTEEDGSGKEYISVDVVEPQSGIEDSVRFWLHTEQSANISFNTIRQILVHKAKTEEDKQKIRDAVDSVQNSDQLVQMLEAAKGGEAWYTKYYDKERTYTDNQGRERRSVNTNLLGYEPKLKVELMPKGNDGITDLDKKTDSLAGTPLAGGQDVPFESKGDAPGSTVPEDGAWGGGK